MRRTQQVLTMPNPSRKVLSVDEQIATFSGKHVVVVGDLMLDEFARGEVRRISPEAPVPILEVVSRAVALGGAANAAANVVSLGGRVTLIGVLGEDAPGATFERLLREQNVGAEVVKDPSRPTTHKTRLVARGQQIVRIDQESRAPLDANVRATLAARATAAVADADACILSDYAKGSISAELVEAIVHAARPKRIPIVADPKSPNFSVYRGVTVVTPNLSELESAVGRQLHGDAEIQGATNGLLAFLDGGAILVTRSAEGMTLFERGRASVHVATAAKSVFDVTGAGDTVVATIAIALAAGLSLSESIHYASAAAGIVVSKVGTATASQIELANSLREAT